MTDITNHWEPVYEVFEKLAEQDATKISLGFPLIGSTVGVLLLPVAKLLGHLFGLLTGALSQAHIDPSFIQKLPTQVLRDFFTGADISFFAPIEFFRFLPFLEFLAPPLGIILTILTAPIGFILGLLADLFGPEIDNDVIY